MIAFFNEVGVVHTEVMNALKRAYGQAPATAVLCALTILIYLLTVVESRSIEHNLSDSWIADHWTLYGPYSHGLGWLRMVGTVFLHSGPTHLALNMFMLFFFGREIEHYLGSGRFTLAYIVSGIGASATVLLMDPLAPTVGASGAVYGLMAIFVAMSYRLRRDLTAPLILIAVNVGYSLLMDGVSLWGHLGGLLTSCVLGIVLVIAQTTRGNKRG